MQVHSTQVPGPGCDHAASALEFDYQLISNLGHPAAYLGFDLRVLCSCCVYLHVHHIKNKGERGKRWAKAPPDHSHSPCPHPPSICNIGVGAVVYSQHCNCSVPCAFARWMWMSLSRCGIVITINNNCDARARARAQAKAKSHVQ